MLASFLVALFASEAPQIHIAPEIEWNYSASNRGGSDFRVAATKRLPHNSNASSGSSENVFRIGCAILKPVSEKLHVTAGLHFGYASGNSMGDAVRNAVTYLDTLYPAGHAGEELDLEYFLADIQLGARYWAWRYVGLGLEVDVERGLWGNYNWKSLSDVSFQKGESPRVWSRAPGLSHTETVDSMAS